MGGLQRQHNPWQGGQELVHRTPISAAMRPAIEKRVSQSLALEIGNFILVSEMIIPFTHRYAEDAAAGQIWRLGAHMKDVLTKGRDDFEMYCPGFEVINPEIPLTESAIARPAIVGLSREPAVKPEVLDATFEVLIMRSNRLLPENSPLLTP